MNNANQGLNEVQTYPALFGLYRMGFLPKGVKIVGYARTKMDVRSDMDDTKLQL